MIFLHFKVKLKAFKLGSGKQALSRELKGYRKVYMPKRNEAKFTVQQSFKWGQVYSATATQEL